MADDKIPSMYHQETDQLIQLSDDIANKFTLKCLLITICAIFVAWFLGLTGIFIVDIKLMTTGLLLTILIFMIPLWICCIAGTTTPWVKYMIMFFAVLGTTVLGITLTYHTVLLSVLPLFYSIQYTNKKMIYYSYILTVISVILTVLLGYRFGLCDANMLLITTGQTSEYVNQINGHVYFDTANPNPWITLPLYFILPRCVILLLLLPAIQHISDNIAVNAVRMANIKKLSETDQMTGLFNKNKYLQMISDFYPHIKQVGIIFWDVNNLKMINDKLGHVHGDHLISIVASNIRSFTSDSNKAYRVGGDEFIMILENVTEDELLQMIDKWNASIVEINASASLPVSVAIGYAYGEGKDIKVIIDKADEKMYLTKEKMHQHR